MKTKLKSEKGFTLIELLIVMLAGLILVASAGRLADSVYGGTKQAKVEQGLSRLRANIQQLYATNTSYDGMTTEKIIKAGGIPIEFNHTETEVTTPFNSGLTIGNSGDDKFWIQITDVPHDVCSKILGSTLNGVWNQVDVNDKSNIQPSDVVNNNPCNDNSKMTFYSE